MDRNIDFCISKAMNELHDEFVKEGYIPQWKGEDCNKTNYLLAYLTNRKNCILTFGDQDKKLKIHLLYNGAMIHQGSLEIANTKSEENVDKIKNYVRDIILPILKEY